eukprot:gene13494-28621_t
MDRIVLIEYLYNRIEYLYKNNKMLEISKSTTRKIFFVTGVVGAILCNIVSVLCGGNSLKSNDYEALNESLQSVEVQNSYAATVALSTLILYDLILDSYYFKQISVASSAIWILCLSLLVPSYIIFFGINSRNLIYMNGITTSKYILVMTSTCLLLSEYGQKIWNHINLIVAVQAFTILKILDGFEPFEKSLAGTYYSVGRIIILTVITIFFCIPTFHWIRLIISSNILQLPKEDLLCTGILAAFWILIFGGTLLNYGYGGGDMLRTNKSYIAAINYLYTAYAVAIITVNGRVRRYESTRLHERKEQELNQKRSFVRYVSHEIRTPLNTVTMGIRLIKRELADLVGPGGDELSSILVDIEDSCDTAVQILNELLDYEKLEAGIMTIDKSKIMVKTFLNKTIRPFHLNASEKRINLDISYGTIPELSQDHAYMMVTIDITPVTAASNTTRRMMETTADPVLYNLRLSVKDSGPGISKEEKNNNDPLKHSLSIKSGIDHEGSNTMNVSEVVDEKLCESSHRRRSILARHMRAVLDFSQIKRIIKMSSRRRQ